MQQNLPPELQINILSRLPVDSLLRFRCVSKSYCAEIENPKFIKTHLERSLETDSNLGMISKQRNADPLFFISSFDSPDSVVELDYPSKMDAFLCEKIISTVGSCNGLLCFSNEIGRLALINPSTRKFQILPIFPFETNKKAELVSFTSGFGYDPISDDYKVVRLCQFLWLSSQCILNEITVYNLKSNSWRKIEGGTSYVIGSQSMSGVLLGDSLHWLADRNGTRLAPELIVAFNLETEKFTEVPQPQFGEGQERPWFLHLGTVGKCLLLCAMYDYGEKLDFWVMKEYRVKESWTKLVSSFRPNGTFRFVTETYFSRNGDEFLLGTQGKDFVWYDLKEKTMKHRKVPADVGLPVDVDIFHGTLVHLNDNTKKATSKKPGSRGKKKDKKNRDGFICKRFKLKL